MSEYDMQSAVQAGATLLDQDKPGWWESVDTANLRMVRYESCIIGQVYAARDFYAFDREVIRLGAIPGDLFAWGEAHGFDLPGYPHERPEGVTWDALEDAWQAVIAERIHASQEG